MCGIGREDDTVICKPCAAKAAADVAHEGPTCSSSTHLGGDYKGMFMFDAQSRGLSAQWPSGVIFRLAIQ